MRRVQGFLMAACIAALLSGCGGGSPASSSPTSTLSVGLIHEWIFDGNANDSVGTLNGAVVGPITYLPAAQGYGFTGNGTTTGVNIPLSSDLQFQSSFTISGWGNLAALPKVEFSSLIFDGDDRAGLDPYALGVDVNGDTEFEITGAGGQNTEVMLKGTMPLNTWVLLTGTYDQTSGTMSFYQNGQIVAQQLGDTTLTPVVPLIAADNAGTGIGNGNDFGVSKSNWSWQGSISDIRVYNRALSASEVLALYNQGSAIRTAASAAKSLRAPVIVSPK